MIPVLEVDAFWLATIDCLVRYHGLTHEEARSGVATFRHRIAQSPLPNPDEMVYHDEPFNVACDIAGSELDRFAIIDEYERLLNDALDRTAGGLTDVSDDSLG
ncbi:MAG TPA: hypothetical protein VF710_03720 [Longimicrobium sp.]|jgi:hypothetical protein